MSNKRKKSKTSSKKRSTTKRKPASRKPATRTGTAARGTNKRKNSKNRKNKIILISVLVALCIVLAVVIGVIVHLSAPEKVDTSENGMDKIISTAWEESKTELENTPEFVSRLENKSSFDVKDVQDDGEGHYTVTVDVEAPDISQALQDYQDSISDKAPSKEEMDKEICNIIDNAEMKNSKFTLTVIEVDGEYDVRFSDGFIDAMYGYSLAKSMNQVEDLYKL